MLMTAGGNAPVPIAELVIRVISDIPTDVSAFCLYANGKVSGDADMIFYGHKSSNDQAVILTDEGANTTFTVNLPKLNKLVQKIAFSCTCDAGQTVSSLSSLSIQIEHHNKVLLQANVDLKGRTESALILGELYSKNNEWKFRFISQGFNGGLKPLAEFYGIEVDEDQVSTAVEVQQPKAAKISLSKISLTKSNPTVSLTKRSDYGLIKINLNWNSGANQKKGFLSSILGSSSIDLDLGAFIRLNNGDIDVVQALGNRFGALERSPYVYLLEDDRTGTSTTGEWLHINGEYWKDIKEVLVFAFIYKGVADWTKTDGVVTINVPNEPPVETRLTEGGLSNNMCAVAKLANQDGTLNVQRLDRYFSGHKALDEAFGWGFNWRAGNK